MNESPAVTWLIAVASFIGLYGLCVFVAFAVWTLFWVDLDCGCVTDPYHHHIRRCPRHPKP